MLAAGLLAQQPRRDAEPAAPECGSALANADVPSARVGQLCANDSCTAANDALFDHLVGAGEQRRRHLDALRSCGPEVNDEFETR